ncbi:HD domain-containing protein [symbiont of Argiope bruennichi]|uniref:HD domain-containing protein n=1 Tax=symbiont of Argiope bruennichi TaxID=2810479 RepID=UPI003DA203E0
MTIKDPIHNIIKIEDEIFLELLSTKEIQRMRFIKQLGMAEFVYPSAVHNRFCHSVGVFSLASKIWKKFFNKEKNQNYYLFLSCAILHDVGHGPFSHTFEYISKNKFLHEEITKKIILDPVSEVNKVLKKYEKKLNISLIKEIIEVFDKKYSDKWIVDLLSSDIDIDRIDYLLRDCYFSGAKYGDFDAKWLISSMELKNNLLYFNKNAISAIENYLICRYHMYNAVYCHMKVSGYDFLLCKTIERYIFLYKNNFVFKNNYFYLIFFVKEEFDLKLFLKLNDFNIWSDIYKLVEEKDDVLQKLSQGFWYRNFFKVISINEKNFHLIEKIKATFQKNNYNLEYFFGVRQFQLSIINEKTTSIKILENDKARDFFEVSNLSKLLTKKIQLNYLFFYEN